MMAMILQQQSAGKANCLSAPIDDFGQLVAA